MRRCDPDAAAFLPGADVSLHSVFDRAGRLMDHDRKRLRALMADALRET